MTTNEAIKILNERDSFGIPTGYSDNISEALDIVIAEAERAKKYRKEKDRLKRKLKCGGWHLEPPPLLTPLLFTFEYKGIRYVETGIAYSEGLDDVLQTNYESLSIDARRNTKTIAWKPLPAPYI